MVHERFFYRNGKKLGPYYYESYRDENGKVKKRYLGTENPDKAKVNEIILAKKDKFILILLIFLVILMDVGVLFFLF
ncbi:hypothetical protein HOE04_02220 [archaeon]|nr:hypothetical protein [archaeon]